MINRTDFAYSQARIHAHYGMMLDEPAWKRLKTIENLVLFLDQVKLTHLRAWVSVMGSHSSPEDVEVYLLKQWKIHGLSLSCWLPAPWQLPFRWALHLIYLHKLPRLWFAHGVGAVADVASPAVVPVAGNRNEDARMLRQLHDKLSSATGDPYEPWQQLWEYSWPPVGKSWASNLRRFARYYRDYRLMLRGGDAADIGRCLPQFHTQLKRWFRRYDKQPLSAYVLLWLKEMEVDRLHGEIIRRCMSEHDEPETETSQVV